MTAGVLALLLGGLGIHQFYLGNTVSGILHILIVVFTCGMGGIVSFIEGIIYLSKSDAEFEEIYVKNKRGWF